MDEAPPTGANRRRGCRAWKRWLGVLGLLPPLGFALSNLWLASPPGRAWIAAKIQQRCRGLETRVGGASWSPWNGFTLREIVISQPPELNAAIAEPLIHIGSLRVMPVWRACLRGILDVRSADLESPRIVVSVQMLSHLAQPSAVPTTPLLAIQPAIPLVASLLPPHQPQASPAPGTATPDQTNVVPAPVTPPQVQPAPATASAEPSKPTGWIHIRHGSFQLVSINSALPLVAMADLSGDLPVSGDAASSSLSLAGLTAHGTPLLADFQAPLAWQSPVLSLKPVEITLVGIHFLFAAKLALLSGLPLQLEVQMPKQSPAPLALADGGEAKAAQLASAGRFRGLLLAPSTWQGDCLAQSAAISIKATAHQASFESGTCIIALRGGVLSCVDARLVGEELSLLGNATVFADGRAAGVVRLVAPSETTLGIVRRLFPKCEAVPALTPMATPQRVACDLEVFGNLNEFQVRLGHNGPVMPLP